jgi:hypothetical protein
MTASRFYPVIVTFGTALVVGCGERPAASPALTDTGAKLPDGPPASDAPIAAEAGPTARPGDAWLDNYRFRSGDVHPRLRIHYSTHVIQDGSDQTFGHATMAHPELWASHVAQFMRGF